MSQSHKHMTSSALHSHSHEVRWGPMCSDVVVIIPCSDSDYVLKAHKTCVYVQTVLPVKNILHTLIS